MFKKLMAFVLIVSGGMPLAFHATTEEVTSSSQYCSYENGQWFLCGHDQSWWDTHSPGTWQKYGFRDVWDGKPSLTDISERNISWFEQEVYNTEK